MSAEPLSLLNRVGIISRETLLDERIALIEKAQSATLRSEPSESRQQTLRDIEGTLATCRKERELLKQRAELIRSVGDQAAFEKAYDAAAKRRRDAEKARGAAETKYYDLVLGGAGPDSKELKTAAADLAKAQKEEAEAAAAYQEKVKPIVDLEGIDSQVVNTRREYQQFKGVCGLYAGLLCIPEDPADRKNEEAKQPAKEMLDKAIKHLDAAKASMQKGKTDPLLGTHFGISGATESDQAAVDRLLEKFKKMKGSIEANDFTIATSPSADLIGAIAFVHGTRVVYTSPEEFQPMSEKDRALVLIHEMSHMDAGTADHAYDWQAEYKLLTPEQRQSNADSFKSFANAAAEED